MIMDVKFWNKRRVLITGFEGFLGSNLTRKLVGASASIMGLDIKTYRKATLLTASDYDKIKVIKGDVANYSLIRKIISTHKIEVVFHLAAEAIVGRSLENPLKTFATNVKGTWNILEASRISGHVKAVVIASSDKAYGSHENLPYTEQTPLIGRHPYDVSKSCADLIANAYFHTYDVPVCVTRCGNIFGPGDLNFSRIIPDTIRSIILNKTLVIRSDGEFTRDYVFVDDIVEGYILLAQELRKVKFAGEAFNFSNENPIQVKSLVEKIYEVADEDPDYKILGQARYEIKHQYLLAEKARIMLGWRPQFNLDDALKVTINWYKNHFDKYLCK